MAPWNCLLRIVNENWKVKLSNEHLVFEIEVALHASTSLSTSRIQLVVLIFEKKAAVQIVGSMQSSHRTLAASA